MWIARDMNGWLCAYNHKPRKDKSDGVWRPNKMANSYLMLDTADFPEVKWEDDEPTEVELTLKDLTVKPRGNFGQWTDAKTLPPEGEDVIIQFVDGSCTVGHYGKGRNTCHADYDKIVWRSDDYWYHEAVIKSWMPLPER